MRRPDSRPTGVAVGGFSVKRYALMAAGAAMTAALLGGAYWAGTVVASPSPSAKVPSAPVHTLSSHGARTRTSHCLYSRSLRILTHDTARALHLSPQAFRKDLASGKTPATLAVGEGSSATALETTLTTELSAHVKKAQAAGRLSASRAATIEAHISARVDHFVTNPPAVLRWSGRRLARFRARMLLLRDTARALKMTPAGIRADLHQGESLAAIASAHGSSAAALESTLIADATSVIQHAVTVGRLTAARAARIEKMLPARIDRLVTATPRSGAHPTGTPAAPNVS